MTVPFDDMHQAGHSPLISVLINTRLLKGYNIEIGNNFTRKNIYIYDFVRSINIWYCHIYQFRAPSP